MQGPGLARQVVGLCREPGRPAGGPGSGADPCSAMLDILNNNAQGYAGLSFNNSGGYVPSDTCGAAGPFGYVETVNQAVALFPDKNTGAAPITDTLSHFLFTTGGLSRADSGSGLSDPIVCYDEKINRFIIGDQDVNFSTHVSAFDLAVSRTSNPTTLSAADWKFYKINTTQSGYDADYPGNFGYNADAFVFTLNMFGVSGGGHARIVSVKAADLASAVDAPGVYANDLNDFSIRPTTMHDSQAGDPMWFTTEHGDGRSIDVIKMTGVLGTTPTFGYTNIPVASYSDAVSPLNPDGTLITDNIDSRIDKSAASKNLLVAAHSVSLSSTQDVIQWYAIDLSGTPFLQQQGRISGGANTYLTYPGIDINPNGDIGLSYLRSGTDTSTDFLSMFVTGRMASDQLGTMQEPLLVPAAKGQANYRDFTSKASSGGRSGDLSGINVDPITGSFWAVNAFANTQSSANWGTGIANFRPNPPANAADLVVTATGPSTVTAGQNATYTLTISNAGPNPAKGVVLTDLLPAGASLVSITKTSGPDLFNLSQSGSTITETAADVIASGSSDSFQLVVTASASSYNGAAFNNRASVSADGSSNDPNTSNNSVTVNGTITGGLISGDLAVTNVASVGSANEGDTITFTVKVLNRDTLNPATGVVLTDSLDSNLLYVSAATSQGTFSRSGNTLSFSIGTMAAGATVTLTVKARPIEEGTAANAAQVSASSPESSTANNAASATISVAEPSITVSAPKTITSRFNSNITVATFTHAAGIEPANAFVATINWGDGTSSSGSISLSGSTYTVKGSHNYTSYGSRRVTTTVREIGLAAELLMAKMGDESPELPDRLTPGCPLVGSGPDQFTGLLLSHWLLTSAAGTRAEPDPITSPVERNRWFALLLVDQRDGLDATVPLLDLDRGGFQEWHPPVSLQSLFRHRRG